jgi:hypothetical protein
MFNRSEFDRLQAGLQLRGYSPQMVEYFAVTAEWAEKSVLPAAREVAASIETPITNEPQTELRPYTEAEMAEMTFEFRIGLNREVEEIYAHAMGVKL